MAKYTIEDTTLTNIASAIREKTGKSELLLPSQMPSEIQSISGGGEDFYINDASYLFYNLARINDIDLYLPKIRNVNNFSYCFYGCSHKIKKEILDLSLINMSECSSFQSMFQNASSSSGQELKNIIFPNNLNSAENFYQMFSGIYLPKLDISNIQTSNLIDAGYMFQNCRINNFVFPKAKIKNATYMFYSVQKNTYDNTIPFNEELDISNLDFSECTNISNFSGRSDFKTIKHNNFDCSKVKSVSNFATNHSELKNLCPLFNLGKGYTQKSANYSSYKLDLSSCVNLTHDSLVGIINGLYDLNITYDVASGGTLYTQQLVLGSTNLAKLTEDEIAIATNKGWVIS